MQSSQCKHVNKYKEATRSTYTCIKEREDSKRKVKHINRTYKNIFLNQKVQRKNTSHNYSADMLWGRKGRHELCPLQPQLHPSPSEPPDTACRQKELYSRLSARQIVQKQTATMHPKFTGLLLDFTSMSWLQRQQRKIPSRGWAARGTGWYLST